MFLTDLARSIPSRTVIAVSVLFLAAAASPAAAQVTSADMGSGVGWIDANGDDRVDLIILTPQGQVNVLLNEGAGVFNDITEEAIPSGIEAVGSPGLGVVAGDVNNDGTTDVFITLNGTNFLLINDGTGRFEAVSRKAGIFGEHMSASAAMFDYDKDGMLDIYVVNYMGAPNQLFHATEIGEDGVPRYEEIAADLGLDLAPNGQSNWGLGVIVADFDNDADTDLYVANDYDGPNPGGFLNPGTNVYYRNNGDGTFTDATEEAGLGDPGFAMGVSFADFDNDGWLDIYIANFWEDVLYQNQGDGTFRDVARDVGLITDLPGEWHYNGWGTAFIDFDNDGDLDIHVANGFIPNDQGQIEDNPDQLWENLGPGSGGYSFRDISDKAGVGQTGDSRGAAYGDYDGDGLTDIFVINNDYLADGTAPKTSPSRCVFVNQGDGTFRDRASSLGFRDDFPDGESFPAWKDATGNHWIDVVVDGDGSGIGSRIAITAGGITRICDVGVSSYCSQNTPFQHFGLGDIDIVDAITVTFPSGNTVTLTDVPVDRIVTVTDPAFTPVRLLAFDLQSGAEGVRLAWQWADDGDLAAFRVTRRDDDAVVTVADGLFPADGRGEVVDAHAPAGRTLEYTLDARLRDGTIQTVRSASIRHDPVLRPVLGQNVPNPFAASTAIPVFAPAGGAITVTIFDVTGRAVRTLRETVAGGSDTVVWDGTDAEGRAAAAGTYFYRLEGAGETQVRKLVLRR